MSLIYDRRKELGSTPAAHALVVGVGHYDLPDLELVTSVRSAEELAKWLMTHDLAVSLGTCRVLLSPLSGISKLENSASRSAATVDEFLLAASDWRKDACLNRDNIALFYFCGHGFQRSATEDLMLFADFGNSVGPALRSAVSVNNLFQGMAPGTDAPEVARTQLYFIDISRTQVRNERYQLSRPTMIFDEYGVGPDDRSGRLFFFTTPGQPAVFGMGARSGF